MTEPSPIEGRTPRGPGLLKLVLFALIPVTILAVLAELAATLTIERIGSIETSATTGAREYHMRIGNWPWSRRAVTPINSDGFPDREFPVAGAPKECVHVAVIGDSFVLGDGVSSDSSFTSIVGRTLTSRTDGPCVRLFNLGERGSTIPRQARRLRELRPRLRPDVVILAQYQNDLTDLLDREPRDLRLSADPVPAPPASAPSGAPSAAPRPEGSGNVADKFSFLNPRLVRLLAYHAFAAFITNGIHRDELRHWSALADSARRDEAARLMAQYTASFDSLATELARDSVEFGVIVIPSKFDVMAARFPEERFFLGLAEKHALPALRIFPVLDERRSPYTFLMYDGHLNEHGNRVVADAVIAWLLRHDPAPFPALRGSARP